MTTRQIKTLLYDIYDNAGSASMNPTVPIIDLSGALPATSAIGALALHQNTGAWWKSNRGWEQISASTPEVLLSNIVPASASAGTVILDTVQQKPVWYNGSKWATLGSVISITSNYTPSASDSRLRSWFDAKVITKAVNSNLVASDIPSKLTGGTSMTFAGTPVYKYNHSVTPVYTTPGVYSSGTSITLPLPNVATTEICISMAGSLDSGQWGTIMNLLKTDSTTQLSITKNNHTMQLNANNVFPNVPNQPSIISIQISGTSLRFSVNGIFFAMHQGGGLSTAATFSGLRLFDGHTGHLLESLIYYATIDDSERLKIEGYLAQRWGITNRLVTGHPYRSTVPLA
jgi:hypothetical protein